MERMQGWPFGVVISLSGRAPSAGATARSRWSIPSRSSAPCRNQTGLGARIISLRISQRLRP